MLQWTGRTVTVSSADETGVFALQVPCEVNYPVVFYLSTSVYGQQLRQWIVENQFDDAAHSTEGAFAVEKVRFPCAKPAQMHVQYAEEESETVLEETWVHKWVSLFGRSMERFESQSSADVGKGRLATSLLVLVVGAVLFLYVTYTRAAADVSGGDDEVNRKKHDKRLDAAVVDSSDATTPGVNSVNP